MFYRFFILFFALINAPTLQAQSEQEKILTALHNASQNVMEAILDEDFKTRGEYDLISGTWHEYELAWHTAQLINGLLSAYEISKEEKLLQTAIKAGDWWVGLQLNKPDVMKGMLNALHGAEVGELINMTTITDGTPALFRLSKITGNPKYAQTATEAGDWMLKHLYIEQEGLFYNIIDPKTGEVWKDKSPHAQHKGQTPTLQMVARPNVEGFLYKDMYDFTGKENYKKVFLNQCDRLIERQSENGFWMDFEPNDAKKGKIHPRFNTWNAEALLEAYHLTKDKKYIEAALKTARALQKLQQKNGIIYYYNYTDGTFKEHSVSGSSVAFAGILWLQLREIGYGKEFEKNISLCADWLLKNQFPITHPDKNLAGAFLETKFQVKDRQIKLIIRDISTAFGMRFLGKYYQSLTDKE